MILSDRAMNEGLSIRGDDFSKEAMEPEAHSDPALVLITVEGSK